MRCFSAVERAGNGEAPSRRTHPLNVLHLVHGRSYTGGVAAARTDVLALQAAGHRAWLGGRAGTALQEGAREGSVPFMGGFRMGRGLARMLNLQHDLRRLREAVKEQAIEVVHVHRSEDEWMAHLALRRGSTARLVRTWHRDPARNSAPRLLKLARICDGCCCVSRAHVEAVQRAGARVAEYIPAGVDTERFRPSGTRREGPALLGLIGRMKAREDRGQRAFLEVLARLDPKLAWRARLIGHGEGVESVSRALRRHAAKERIEIRQRPADFPAEVAALDLGMVFATGSDGTSRPALEMLASGVPILLADRPGLRELAEDPGCARLLPGHDGVAWARACEAWLRDRKALAEMGVAARRRAEAVHGLPVRGKALAEFYARTFSTTAD